MSYQLLGNTLTLLAAADLSSSINCAVYINSAGKFALASAGGAVAGILTDKAQSGKACPAQVRDVAQWKLGGTVAAGDAVKSDSSGRAVTASAADIASGVAKGICVEGGTINQVGAILLLQTASGFAAGGVDDIVLGTTAPSVLTETTFVQTTGTKTGALGAGIYAGQRKRIIQSVAASSPIGTITGSFKTLAGAAATTLALGTAVATIADFVWDGTYWRATSAITGTGSSLS